MGLLTTDKKQSLPYGYYWWPAFILAIIGMADTIYLAVAHYRNYTDLTWSSFCAISRAVNCDTVAQSPWSVFLNIPIAIWGVIGYSMFMVLLLSVWKSNPAIMAKWALLTALALIFSVTAVTLGYISATRIGSYCILCLLSYLISFLLLLYSWITWRRFGEDSYLQGLRHSFLQILKSKLLIFCLSVLFGSTVMINLFFPRYWIYEYGSIYTDAVNSGITESGHPWIGATSPKIVIEEFSDYQCFQCYKMHFAIRSIIQEHPDKIRLVHRHYPLDHEFNPASPEPFHIGSGRLALLSIAATQQNKFWSVNDYIFKELTKKKSVFDLEEVAMATGADLDKLKSDYFSLDSLKILEGDIRAGLRHNITSTPTFIVDGRIYTGNLPLELLEFDHAEN